MAAERNDMPTQEAWRILGTGGTLGTAGYLRRLVKL